MSLTYFGYWIKRGSKLRGSGHTVGEDRCVRDSDKEETVIEVVAWLSNDRKRSGTKSDGMRRKWTDMERINHTVICWHFVSVYVLSTAAAVSSRCA